MPDMLDMDIESHFTHTHERICIIGSYVSRVCTKYPQCELCKVGRKKKLNKKRYARSCQLKDVLWLGGEQSNQTCHGRRRPLRSAS